MQAVTHSRIAALGINIAGGPNTDDVGSVSPVNVSVGRARSSSVTACLTALAVCELYRAIRTRMP